MSYAVRELFFTLQGEGAQAGRAAVFCRFAGCNLWTGREEDRATAVCRFCDTDFVGTDGHGGGRFDTAEGLAGAAAALWPAPSSAAGQPYVVCTGGEPLLQLDSALIEAFHFAGFEVAVETNGTLAPPPGLDWVCVSPKAGAELVLKEGDELKLVFPQEGAEPERYEALAFEHFFLQPLDPLARGGTAAEAQTHVEAAVRYCLGHPRWRISLQTHKLLGLP